MARTTQETIMTKDYTPKNVLEYSDTSPPAPSYPWFVGIDDGVHYHYPQAPPIDTFVSNEVTRIIEIVFLTVFCGVVSASGLVANVINVLVFFRQGALSSSSNVSLLVLAFADIGCLLPLFCNSVSYALSYLGIPSIFLSPSHFMDTSVVWPHIAFMLVASLITAYIAFERCACVLMPLKVKTLFSAKRTAAIIIPMSMVVILSFIPIFATHKTGVMIDPLTNNSKIVFMPTELHFQVIEGSDIVHAIILRPASLIIVFICTKITIYRVQVSSAWRKSIASINSEDVGGEGTKQNAENKNQKYGSRHHSEQQSPAPSSSTPTKIITGEDGTIENTGKNIKYQEPHSSQPTTTSTSNNQRKNATISKEARLVKMVTLISVIYMVCNAPDIITVLLFFFMQSALPISHGDNAFRVMIASQLCVESINSSVNILVYYRMSSSFRQAFRGLMGLEQEGAR